jgi:PAS domain S-box-containing protein
MGPITPDDLRFNRFGLSAQESKVLALAMSGRIDKMIASEMGISLGTVRVYWKRIRQKVLEESLHRERRLRVYEASFEKLALPLAILDGPSGRIVHANVAFSALHGYKPVDLEEMPSSDLMQSGQAGPLEKAARKSSGTGKPYETVSVRRRKDGTTFEAKATYTEGAEDVWTLSLEV